MISPETTSSVAETVGRVSCERSPIEVGASYRNGATQHVTVMLQGVTGPAARRAPGWVMSLILVLSVLLLVFAMMVRSGPAIGMVSIIISGLGLMVIRSRVPVGEPVSGRIELERDGIEWSSTGGDTGSRPIAAIESFGTGEDGALRTFFLKVRDEGRVLLLDGLTVDEARAVDGWLREELARRAAQRDPK